VRQRGATAGADPLPVCAGCDVVEEPLRATDDPSVAAVKMPIVATCMRFGVSHDACWACSHVRAPVAPVMAAIAQTAHMGGIMPPHIHGGGGGYMDRRALGRRLDERLDIADAMEGDVPRLMLVE
jgi:hypothetical protein